MNKKIEQLEKFTISSETPRFATTNTGCTLSDDGNSLKAGRRGPTLLEDFALREKLTHFDHERIPERIVHARGSGAHGYFQSYKDHSSLTKAGFLSCKDKKTPLFARISTVQGPRGSADTVRDVRGFAIKFYTDEGNYDLVGNNMPVFFIQDASEFPDFVHAVKMDPSSELNTGSSAHDSFYDFCTNRPESSHMLMWLMSDRAIPISLRHQEGFGVHTYRLINADNVSTFVKFHWKPLSGTCSFQWDECQKLAGKDPDYNRRRLWEDIENGDYPQWELCVQILDDKVQREFEFDILDPTKLIPEELAPLVPLGRMVLDRNPDNFFAETEQIAFCVSHVVPGIDFSNDPLLQGRLFSYLDTQLTRLGGPNFNEIPINRPVCPFANNQRDGIHRQTINKSHANYFPNTLDKGYPKLKKSMAKAGGFRPFSEKLDSDSIKSYNRSETFDDHFSQATMFWNSMSQYEKDHIVSAFTFELSKVQLEVIRFNFVNLILVNIDKELAEKVANNIGIKIEHSQNVEKINLKPSFALSQKNLLSGDIVSRRIAIIVSNGIDYNDSFEFKKDMEKRGAKCMFIGSDSIAPVKCLSGEFITPQGTLIGNPSITFDACYIPLSSTSTSESLSKNGNFLHFILESYKHLKTIGFGSCHNIPKEILFLESDYGLLYGNGCHDLNETFFYALAHHRNYSREDKVDKIPA